MFVVGSTENNHEEDEGKNCLNNKCATAANLLVTCSTFEELTITISGESADLHTCSLNKTKEYSSCNDSANDLCAPVEKHLFPSHTTVAEYAKRNGRIQAGMSRG